MRKLFAIVVCVSVCAVEVIAGGLKTKAIVEGTWTAVGGNLNGKVIPDAVMAERKKNHDLTPLKMLRVYRIVS